MSNDENTDEIDRVLDVISKPINRYILSVLAGVNPGTMSKKLIEPKQQSESEESDKHS